MNCCAAKGKPREHPRSHRCQSGAYGGADRTPLAHSSALLRRNGAASRTRNAQLRALLATVGRARVRGSSAEADRATAPSVPHSGREGVIEFQLEAAAAESGTDHENLTGRRVPGPP